MNNPPLIFHVAAHLYTYTPFQALDFDIFLEEHDSGPL